MNLKVNGQIRYIGKDNVVDSSKNNTSKHVFKILVVETLENSYLAIHCWDEAIDKIKDFKVNDVVGLQCRLESHRNRKNKDLWYHKLLLR